MTRRRILIVVAIVLLLPVLALGALILVAQSEWGEGWVEQRVANTLKREVDIEGISIKLGWPPRVVFGKLRIGNPPWAKTPNLIDAEGLYARVAVPPLFAGKVVLPYLGAARANAGLELDGMALAIVEAHGFHARIARQGPGEARRGVLTAGK